MIHKWSGGGKERMADEPASAGGELFSPSSAESPSVKPAQEPTDVAPAVEASQESAATTPKEEFDPLADFYDNRPKDPLAPRENHRRDRDAMDPAESRETNRRKGGEDAAESRETHRRKGGEDPPESREAHRRKGGEARKDEKAAAAVDQDPLAAFYDNRPKVTDFEDPEEAFRTRVRNNRARSRSRTRGSMADNGLERRIQAAKLDEACAAALRRAPPRWAHEALEASDLQRCRNPSALVMKTLRRFEDSASHRRDPASYSRSPPRDYRSRRRSRRRSPRSRRPQRTSRRR